MKALEPELSVQVTALGDTVLAERAALCQPARRKQTLQTRSRARWVGEHLRGIMNVAIEIP
jgi:hypothetical protein